MDRATHATNKKATRQEGVECSTWTVTQPKASLDPSEAKEKAQEFSEGSWDHSYRELHSPALPPYSPYS